jgi:hypothetical protein
MTNGSEVGGIGGRIKPSGVERDGGEGAGRGDENGAEETAKRREPELSEDGAEDAEAMIRLNYKQGDKRLKLE